MTVVHDRPPRPGRRLDWSPGLAARFDADLRKGCTVAVAGTLALVTYWWVADGGITDLGGWASGLTSIGRFTGLVASILLLVQVLLLARLPAVERAFGQDRLIRLHRWVGFSSVNLMLVHILTITWGYDGGRIPTLPRQFWTLTTVYPGVLLSVAGALGLVMVAVTSIRAARRRLRYESWHLLHLYAYLGVGVALPHQLWTGQQFVGSTPRTVFWWSAWGAAAAAIVLWRIVVPVAINLRHRLVVAAVTEEGGGIWSIEITGRKLERLRTEAGQFFNWRFLAGHGRSRAHPYSLSAAPDGRSLRITVREVGDGSGRVAAIKPGTKVFVEGPYGRLSSRPRTRPRLAFIGAGVGTTPLRALAEGLEYDAGDAVYLERYTDQPLFPAEIDQLARKRGLEVIRVGGRRRSPESWLGAVSDPDADDLATLLRWIPDLAERDVYVCGPPTWTTLVVTTLRSAGLRGNQLHLENFTW